jgi:UDP-glucose 6-dehydrogenase
LRDQGASVVGHDLLAIDEVRELEPELKVSINLDEVLSEADVVVALNSESIYSKVNWSLVAKSGTTPYVLDTRGILDAQSLRSSGLNFVVLGSMN